MGTGVYYDENGVPRSAVHAAEQGIISSNQAGYFGTTDSGLKFLTDNADSYLNAVNQEALWKREDFLRRLAEQREDYSLDRIVEAAKRNGINPIFLMNALGGNTVGNAASYATSAAKTSAYDTNARTDQATSAKMIGALISALVMIGFAILK